MRQRWFFMALKTADFISCFDAGLIANHWQANDVWPQAIWMSSNKTREIFSNADLRAGVVEPTLGGSTNVRDHSRTLTPHTYPG
ncbi:MAG: hypothetical protein WBL23_04190 [Salinisphaera sp.]|uniref:hypothetical protein n=1 Tax=Salinisphaera sp. TaxID=1914330 RepID=UPI003C7ACD5A